MCGFIGYFDSGSVKAEEFMRNLRAMSDTLVHRGPDSKGEWIDEGSGIGLAHRRLAIQDLSPLGHQPMISVSGRYVIIYNGEIYNFLEIKTELEKQGLVFRGHSDTEVMLAAFEKWGLRESLARFTGMFAFALWDSVERVLFLARDRMGEKPLYYGWQDDIFIFGSELKAFRKHPDWKGEIDRDAITLLLRHNYIPAPHTIFQGIHKLMPGSLLTFKPKEKECKSEQYWCLKNVTEKARNEEFKATPVEIAEKLELVLLNSIARQMIADVPVGAFLSGGIDSSTVVALMQSLGTSKVKTFTIGFEDDKYNEAEYAKVISERLGTDHTELYVSPEQALDVIPRLARIYDEPFADSSQIPTYLVSQLTRQKVTVSLSGDGGDELFCGYPHYFGTLDNWNNLNKYPQGLRKLAGGCLGRIPQPWLDSLGGFAVRHLSNRNPADAGRKIHELANEWTKTSLMEVYQHYNSYWKDAAVVLDAKEPTYIFNEMEKQLQHGSVLQNLQYWDMSLYLPDDILTKVDRAAMANSLETRVPLLDHNVVEYALRIPEHVNLMHKNGKWPLRYILEKYVPARLFERPKMGFAVPIADWLRGPLFEWADALLNEARLGREGYFNPSIVRTIWHAHTRDKKEYAFYLWGILMFQSWLAEYQQEL